MAFEKLRQAPCFQQVHDRLEAGIPVEKVAAWAQEDAKCLLQTKRASLIRVLYRYKSQMTPTVAAVVGSATQGGKVSLKMWDRIQDMERGINEVEELEKLYLLQLKRIGLGNDTEIKINFMDKNVRREVQLAAELLEKSVDMKMRLGILKDFGKTVNVNHNVTSTKPLTEGMDQEQKAKVSEAARAVLAHLLTPKAESAEPEYEIVQEEKVEVPA